MKGRIQALDALRGFALLGIILGNVTWFSGYAVGAVDGGALDRVVEFAIHVLVDGKFYGLFSLMFGAGFALIVARAGASAARVVRRRLVALLAIGLAHATLLWFGDIISLYAVAAVPLYWTRNWSVRRLSIAAVTCLTAPVLVSAVLLVAKPAGDPSYGPAASLPAFGSGGYSEMLSANWEFLRQRWVLALYSSRLVRILGLFLLGMIAVRIRPRVRRHPAPALVATALASNVALALLSDGLTRDVIYAVAIPTGSLAYAAVLWPRLSSPGLATRMLAAAGRLSLTHYVTQSLAMAAVFYGCGLGQWGRMGLVPAVAIALGIVGAQVLASAPWLRRFGHGPGEWLLRVSKPTVLPP